VSTSESVVRRQFGALLGKEVVAAAKPTPSGICPAAGGDPSGTIPLGGIVLANKP
jgi:hypothetical protein